MRSAGSAAFWKSDSENCIARGAFVSLKASTLRECHTLLGKIEKLLFVYALCVDFAIGDELLHLNALFNSDGVHGMPGVFSDYRYLFPFTCAFVGKAPGYTRDGKFTKVNSFCS